MKAFAPTPEFDARFRELYEAGAAPRSIMSALGIDKPIFISTKRRLDLHRNVDVRRKREWTKAERLEFIRLWERGDSLHAIATALFRPAEHLSVMATTLGVVRDPTRFERLGELTRRLAAGEDPKRIADVMDVAPVYLDAVIVLHGLNVRFRGHRLGSASHSGGHLSRWTPDRDAELGRLHAAGSTLTAMAKALGVHPATVNRRLHVLGLVVDPRFTNRVPDLVSADAFTPGATATMKASVATPTVPEVVWTAKQDDRIAKLFAVGVRPDQIAKEFGRDVAVVRDRIATLGLKKGSLERHPSAIIALGTTPAAPKQDVVLVDREAITAFTRDGDGFEVAASAYGVDVDRRFKAAEVRGIDDALDRTVAALRALVVADRITAGAPCDPEDVRTALAAAQEAGRVSDALVLAAWKAGVMTVDGRARRRPALAAKGTRAPRFRWTPEQDTQLRNLWIKGDTRREISDKLGIPMTTVRDRTIKLKLPTRMWDASAGLSRVTA